MVRRAWFSIAAAAGVAFFACHTNGPLGAAEATCVERCNAALTDRCDDRACVRACRFVLDRLIGGDRETIIACVKAAEKPACDDRVWARCAAQTGVHADGGPPAPPPLKDDEFDDEEADGPAPADTADDDDDDLDD